jgi:hypothetical protein
LSLFGTDGADYFILVAFVGLSSDVDVVVAQAEKFTLHPVYLLQPKKLKLVYVVNVPEVNVFPEFRGE